MRWQRPWCVYAWWTDWSPTVPGTTASYWLNISGGPRSWPPASSRVGCTTTPSNPGYLVLHRVESRLCNNTLWSCRPFHPESAVQHTLWSWLLDSSRDGCTTPSDPGHRFYQETAVQHHLVLATGFIKRRLYNTIWSWPQVLSRDGCTTPSGPDCLIHQEDTGFIKSWLYNNKTLWSWLLGSSSVASTTTLSDPGCLVFRHRSPLQQHSHLAAWFFCCVYKNTLWSRLLGFSSSVASTKTPSDPGCLIFRHQSLLHNTLWSWLLGFSSSVASTAI